MKSEVWIREKEGAKKNFRNNFNPLYCVVQRKKENLFAQYKVVPFIVAFKKPLYDI